ncbi:2138_t:CDS:2 [Entrophospora sp. SA101]|nr:2138_t:CDS:2 [Entrophospora sp. SA101]
MLFLRALTYFGRYFVVILGVARKVDYTLYSPDFRDGDPNSPWNLASKYFTYFESNNSYDQNSIIVQQPDGNTNINQIENYDITEAFVAQKAKIITDIELFYLLPNQRRWREWFPDTLYYYAPIENIREQIKKIDCSNEEPGFLPFISNELRKLVDVPKPDNLGVKQVEKNLRNDLEEIKYKLKYNEQMLQALLEKEILSAHPT